ncbi:WYL domain-containing protein [Sinorhizobium saheli]|uniref:WYL domain-containing protein n=1 Tax=Sinorhizobium saheli TaxID=36856 RepID=UPI0012964F56
MARKVKLHLFALAKSHATRARAGSKSASRRAPAYPAIADARRLHIADESLAEETSERTICPLGLSVFGHFWLLTAWCDLRPGFRVFRVDRLRPTRVGSGTSRHAAFMPVLSRMVLGRATSHAKDSREKGT